MAAHRSPQAQMRRAATSLAALALFASPVCPAHANEPFADKSLSASAQTYEAQIKKALAQPQNRTARDLKAEGDKMMAVAGIDGRAAVDRYLLSVLVDATDSETWLALANALLATKPDPVKSNDAAALAERAGWTAYRAYELAKTAPRKATALATLGEARKRRAQWRGVIDAYAASVALADNARLRTALTEVRAQHGFRVIDTKIDSDAATPRACIIFSERLSTGQTEWAKFLKLDGREPQSVTADDKQLCVDGLTHGRDYKLEVRAGVPSVFKDEPLQKSADLKVYVRDRSPSVRAAGKAYVLPANGQHGIPLTTMNAGLIGVEVYRIGDRNLAPSLEQLGFARQGADADDIGQVRERMGQKVYAGEMSVPNKINEEVATAFPVSEALPKLQPGLYMLSANVLPVKSGETSRQQRTAQWFIVSDLGLSTLTGSDGLHVFVRSLTGAAAMANTTVRLIAKNNEVLGSAITDARGYARFDTKLHKGEAGLAPALIAAETQSGDYAFLDMTAAAFDLTDRGVKGRAAPGPVDAFAYTDRGVYRPGETAHLTALIRDAESRAATTPVTLIISRPDGVEHRRLLLADQGIGGRAHALQLGANAMTGTWRAKVYTDPKAEPIASLSFLVEDFVPERMDMKLTAATPSLSLAQGGAVTVVGKYLYGPPAANLAIEGDIVVRPAKLGLAAFPGYRFGKSDEKIVNVRKPLEDVAETSADGTARVEVKLPELEKTAVPLEADVILRLREANGRTIERSLVMPVDLNQRRIGIKPGFVGDQAKEGADESFDVIMVDGRGASVDAKGLKWELVRLEQRWQWFSRGDSYTYDMQTVTRRVSSGVVDVAKDQPGKINAKLDWGRYRLEVSSADGAGPVLSSVAFNAGYYADESADSPEMLDLALDKPSYRVGDVARVKVASRFAGKALITVLSGTLKTFKEADIPAGGGEVALDVTEAWGAGSYVTVTVFRPLDGTAKRMPGRAMGLRWLPVDQEARTLNVAIQAPDKTKPGSALTIPIRVSGLKAGEDARVTLAATDIGILNLTRFEPPKPESWFYGQRKLGLDVRDFYSRLIDGMKADKGRLRSGGDGSDGESVSAKGAPPVEKTLALFSGIVKVDANGQAEIPLQLPDFNGTVRLSAVAWSGDKVGSSSKDMIVRDALALTVSAPRFLTLGDTARLAVDVHNVEGPASDYKVNVTLNPVVGLASSLGERTLALQAGEKKAESLQLKPADLGAYAMTVTVTGPNGIQVKRPLTFDVKPPSGDIRRTTVAELAATSGRITLSTDLLQDLIPSSARATVNVGPLAALDVASLLNQLDRYPYGCAEQTTSRALPLLYANDIARQIGLGQDADLAKRIDSAIARVFEMQDSSGAFGIWGPQDGDLWLTSYVTDFLLRAKDAKFAVEQRGLKLALDRLQNFIATAQDFEKGGESRAYALYVLARGGRAPAGDVRYFVDARLDRFATPLALAHIGAAASLIGDKPRADLAFAASLKKLDGAEPPALRDDYGSHLRDRAAVITLASEAKMSMGRVPQLTDVLAKAYSAKQHTSTQEQAWMLLAARALAEQADGASLTINGEAHRGRLLRSYSSADLSQGSATITNTASDPTRAVISVVGSSLTTEPAIAKGMTVTRSYYTLDGKPVDLKSATGGTSTLKQNDRMVVVLKVKAEQVGGRILLVDRIPAGLEIENARLVDSGDVKSLDWLKTTRKPQHTEFRDDRFVAAFDFFESERSRRGSDDDDAQRQQATNEATVAYIVRAVTPGAFVHPAATVEDMYRPDRHARTAAGKLDVTGK
jgi:alpha-2-macroglobulin